MAVSVAPLLLDTCALIFIGQNLPIKPGVKDRLRTVAHEGQLFVSAVSAWELGMLHRRAKGGQRFLPDPARWIEELSGNLLAQWAPFTAAIAAGASELPGDFHNDPADRLMVSTARAIGAGLVTRDRPILAYAAAGHVSALAC